MLRKHAALLFIKYALEKAVKPLSFGCFFVFQQLFSIYKPFVDSILQSRNIFDFYDSRYLCQIQFQLTAGGQY